MPISFSIEAFRRIDAINEIFRSVSKMYGYTSIVPGSITSYSDLIAYYPDALTRSVKYTGPDGSIYALKSDPTHFVTQLASQNKRTGHNIQKYAYATSKLNWKTNGGKTTESLQCGLEIYDSESVESEAEVIRVACKVLEQSGIGKIVVDLGNINFTELLLETCPVSLDIKNHLRKLIDTKNLPELEALVMSLELTEKQQAAFMALPQMFGNAKETLKRAKSFALTQKAEQAIEHVESLYDTLLDYGMDASMLRLDFSFTNTYSYYTDTIYKIYTADSGQILAAGGRYDDAFGYGLAACGIALYLNEINEVIEMKQQKNSNLYSKDFAIFYDNTNRRSAFQLSDLLRELGFIVTTAEQDTALAELPQSDAEEILKIAEGQLEIINQRMNTFSRSSYEQFIRKVENQYVPSSIH